jgi:hypothetical protein
MIVHSVPRYGIFFQISYAPIYQEKGANEKFDLKDILLIARGCRGCDRKVVGFTTTCAISAYHH